MARIDKDLSGVEAATNQPSRRNDGIIPEGTYLAKGIDSVLKPMKTHAGGNVEWLTITWQIQEGDYKRRQVYDDIYLRGDNAAGVAFGDRKLKALAFATEHKNPIKIDDSSELMNKPCMITVYHDEYNGKTKAKVSTYAKPDSAPSSLRAPSGPADASSDPFADDDLPF